jgi:hypothetical protein
VVLHRQNKPRQNIVLAYSSADRKGTYGAETAKRNGCCFLILRFCPTLSTTISRARVGHHRGQFTFFPQKGAATSRLAQAKK